MDRRIDLTEHGDFGAPHDNILVDNTINMDVRLTTTYEDEPMSIEEYDRVCAWEKVFGRRNHLNEARKLFHPGEDLWPWKTRQDEDTCCCGARLFPWDGHFCQRCRETMAMGFEWEDRNSRYWLLTHSQNMRDERDILNLR